MHKTRTLFVIGIWVAILPYLGFPSFWKNVFFTLSGLGLALYSYIIHRDFQINKTEVFENFSENTNFTENTEREGNEEKIEI